MTPASAIYLLLERFPMLSVQVESEADLFDMPHVTYGLFATEIVDKVENPTFLREAAGFINELADSKDDLLEEYLVIDVLEAVAQFPSVLDALRPHLNPAASAFLMRIEKEFYRC